MEDNLKIVEKKRIDGEKEALEILCDVQSSLDKNDQTAFFFFFVKNSKIFHLQKDRLPLEEYEEIFLNDLLLKNEIEIERILGLDVHSKLVEEKIVEVWEKFIKDNPGSCANYFGAIALFLIRSFLEENRAYESTKREARIFVNGNPINQDYFIDLVCIEGITCDLYECKHTVYPQRGKIVEQMNKLKRVVKELRKIGHWSNCFLATIDFMKKENICYHIQDALDTDHIVNGEDIFDISILS